MSQLLKKVLTDKKSRNQAAAKQAAASAVEDFAPWQTVS
jgi:hypothetical protein